MKSKRIVLLALVALLGSTLPLGAAAPPKFRPSSSGDSGAGRYVITLADDAVVEDAAAMKREVVQLYGAKLEGHPSSDVRQFTVTMTPARARLLSTDPRVSEVVEVSSASAPATPSPTAASPERHFTTQTSGYGDNGQSGTYTYDSFGNITAIGTDTYLYDLEDRLHSSVTRGVTETYVYDAFGNRQSATGAVNCLGQMTCAQPVTLDEHTNRLQTINNGAVQYDTAGNVTAIAGTPSTTYSYDGTGMMIEQTVGSDDRQFVYTADDERIAVRQGLSWTWMVRDPSHKVVREYTSLETPNSGFAMTNRLWLKDYVWRDGLLLATTTSSGTLHYHLDHLGTPRLVTNASGAKVAEHAYYPFGAEIALIPHEAPEEAMKFTGHERDIVAGDGHTLDYMHARFDNASLGRFLSVDSLIPTSSLRNPQRWNRYAYAMNNPVLNIDPTGKDVSIGLRFSGDGWTDAEKKQVIKYVQTWYAAQHIGSVYVFDSAKQTHGRLFGSLLSGHANVDVSMATGRAHEPGRVYAGSIFSDKTLTANQQLQAIGNAIVHETAAHQFHSTYVEAQDQLWYLRGTIAAQKDPGLSARYGTVADSYAFVWPDTKANVTDGPIPIHPDDLRTLQHNLQPVHAEPPEDH